MAKDRLEQALTPTEPEDANAPAGKSPSKDWTISVYVGPEIKSRLERLQTEWGVNASQVTKFLLAYALDAVDAGKLKPKRETVTRVRLE